MIGRLISNVWPLKEFLNYIFKKTLGDYIMNDLDLNKIEVEIKNNTFISLRNIDLNVNAINLKHLKNSPIKMLEGKINRLDLIISMEKIEFKVEEVFILLMPVVNQEMLNNINVLKKKGISTNTDNNVENSLISNLINSAIGNLEVSVRNICIKVLTYEVFDNSGENPCLSFYISKIEYKKIKKDELKKDNEKKESLDYSKGVGKEREKFSGHNNQKYLINIEKNNTTTPKNEVPPEKLFIFNKQIIFDKICIKLNRNIKNDELNFFDICNLNDEKLLFNFFCENSSIFAMNYSLNNDDPTFVNECSFFLNLLEKNNEALKVEIFFKKFEIFLNPLQLQLLFNFAEVCILIFKKNLIENKNNKQTDKHSFNTLSEKVDQHQNSHNQPQQLIKIFNHKISNIEIDFNLDMFNFILTENNYSYEIPKLWTFYEKNYSKKLKTIENLESHFSYTEDNFFILNLNFLKLKYSTETDKQLLTNELDLNIESFNFKYVEYKNKIKSKNIDLQNLLGRGLKFSRISSSKLALNIQQQLQMNSKSINNLSIVNNSIRNDSIYQTVYQSVLSGSDNNNLNANPNPNANLSYNSNMFESAMESAVILVEKFNKLLDYDYCYYSHNLLSLKPQYVSEKNCILFKLHSELNFKNEKIRDEKQCINITAGDLFLEFHPLMIFKFTKIIYPNVILINEFLYYLSNSLVKTENKEGVLNEEISVENLEKNLLNKLKISNQDNKSIKNSPNVGPDIRVNNQPTPKLTPTSTGDIYLNNSKKIQIYFSLNEIKINIHNFQKDPIEFSKPFNTINAYFNDFYKNNLEEVNQNIKNNFFKEKININKESSFDSLKTKDSFLFKLNNFESLIEINSRISLSKRSSKQILYLNFSQIIGYFNDCMILNYKKDGILSQSVCSLGNIKTNTKTDNPSKNNTSVNSSKLNPFTVVICNKNKFVTENYYNPNNNTSQNFNNQPDLDSMLNKNKMKFRKNEITIEIREINYFDINSKNELIGENYKFNYCKNVNQYLENIYTLHNNHKKLTQLTNIKHDHQDHDQRRNHEGEIYKPDLKNFKRILFTINLKESVDIFLDLVTISRISEFIDILNFSLNIHKIFNNSMEGAYKNLKSKIFETYNIPPLNELNYIQSGGGSNDAPRSDKFNQCSNIIDKNYFIKVISISVEKINLFLLKSGKKRSANICYIYGLLNKLNFSLINQNFENELFITLNSIKLLLKRNIELQLDENFDIFNMDNEKLDLNFHHFLYKGNISENLNSLNVEIYFKDVKSYREDSSSNMINLEEENCNLNFNKNYCVKNTEKLDLFQQYLDNNLIKLNDLQLKLILDISDFIFSPIPKNYNCKTFQVIAEEFKQNNIKDNKCFSIYPLSKNRNVIMNLAIKFNKFVVDLIYSISENNKESKIISKQKGMRFLLVIDKLIHEKENSEAVPESNCDLDVNEENLHQVHQHLKSLSKLKIYNLQSHFLKNLNYPDADENLINKINDIGKENSTIKKFGFVEILNSEKIELNLASTGEEASEIDILLSSIELNFCKDSFDFFIKYVNILKERLDEILSLFKSNIKEKEYIDQGNKFQEEVLVKPNDDLNNEDRRSIHIFDNYCQGVDYMKDVILLNDEEEIPKRRRKPSSFYMIPKENEIFNKLNKGDTAINLKLNSFNIYIFEGKDFDFKDADTFIENSVEFNNDNGKSNKTNLYKTFQNHCKSQLNTFHSVMESFDMNKFDIIEDYYEVNKKNKIQTNSIANIYNNSNTGRNTIILSNNETTNITTRDRKRNRDYDNHIGLHIHNINLECILYNDNNKASTPSPSSNLNNVNKCNNDSNFLKTFTIKFSIEKFDIDDYVKLSKYKKLLSKYYHDDSLPFIKFDAELIKNEDESSSNISTQFINNVEVEDSEFYINVKISPINFLLDQYTLIFLLDFFNIKLSENDSLDNFSAKNSPQISSQKSPKNYPPDNTEKSQKYSPSQNVNDLPIVGKNFAKEEISNNLLTKSNLNSNCNNNNQSVKLIFVRKVSINEFFINFSYNSHSISISKIANKNYLELLNLSNITDFRIILKNFDFLGCKTINDILETIKNYWKKDIAQNQIFSAILSSISVIRPFTTILDGFFDIFKQPWIYYKTEKSLKDGFRKGFKNFVFSFSSQSLFLGEKVNLICNFIGVYHF